MTIKLHLSNAQHSTGKSYIYFILLYGKSVPVRAHSLDTQLSDLFLLQSHIKWMQKCGISLSQITT